MGGSQNLQQYLKTPAKAERIALLEGNHGDRDWIPLALAEDLMCLDLDAREHIAILAVTDNTNRIALEDFLTRGVLQWDQNVASVALRVWAQRTDHLLWHRTLPLTRDSRIPQRVSYTLLEMAWYGAGRHYIETFVALGGLEGMSPAFLSLLLHRAVQWNVESRRLVDIALRNVREVTPNLAADRSLAYALSYLMRFKPETLDDDVKNAALAGVWPDIVRSMKPAEGGPDTRLEKFLAKPPKKQFLQKWLALWPRLWERHKLAVETVAAGLIAVTADGSLEHQRPEAAWEAFAGIPADTLVNALLSLKESPTLVRSMRLLGGLVGFADEACLGAEITERFKSGRLSPNEARELPQRYRLWLYPAELDATVLGTITGERARDLKEDNDASYRDRYGDGAAFQKGIALGEDDAARHRFFNGAYRGTEGAPGAGDTLWHALSEAWHKPQEPLLEDLSLKARKAPPIFRIAYINALARFKGVDKAALKLLDFIRSADDDVIRAVIRALVGIGTNRAKQELVAFLTRPNTGLAIQLEITQHLQEADLSGLQHELRSALEDLKITPGEESAVRWELRESLRSLLKVESHEPRSTEVRTASDDPELTTEELDSVLGKKIIHYSLLSSEVKRALRTAQFFHLKVETAKDLQTIDLSPVIDMQYKALELFFRESFEDSCGWVIKDGMLQRKLDIIGYARPVPQAMDEFEKYIEGLPIINTTPFFSRFKLRKMLRALCQYRPGKRFTLDGLKAFALFFACFSRKACRYDLQNLFPIPGFSDEKLFEFCKALHVFQDFRNRAAHEGFHPDAANDITGIWLNTAEIIHTAFEIKEAIAMHFHAPQDRRDSRPATVIIQKRAG